MVDKEKVIMGLETCSHADEVGCDQCPYYGKQGDRGCQSTMQMDALALLKGQTAQWIWDRPHHFRCSACGNNWGLVSMKMRYCPDCGRRMFLSKTELRKEWPDA